MSPVACNSFVCSLSREKSDEIAKWYIIVNNKQYYIQMGSGENLIVSTLDLETKLTQLEVTIVSTGECGGVIARVCLAP
jgi:hypothetical protein